MYSLSTIPDNKLSKVGGKALSLNNLFKISSVKVPRGFVLSSSVYKKFVKKNNIEKYINKKLANLDITDINTLKIVSEKIKAKIRKSKFSNKVASNIISFYKDLSDHYNVENLDVAVRSSSIGEDSVDNSFAGQQDTFLNVREHNLIQSVIDCYASLFNPQAISYRKSRNMKIYEMAVVIQKMVRCDNGASGVAFSLDPETGFDKIVIINANYGLGETVVSGEVDPDEFIYFKETGKIISSKLGRKKVITVYDENCVKNVNVDQEMQEKFCINLDVATFLGHTVHNLEKHLGYHVDVEWAFDGTTMYIVQVRPETVHVKDLSYNKYKLLEKGDLILHGVAVGQKIASGKINIKRKIDNNFNKGDVLVTSITSPDWEPLMKLSSAIITEKGGRTCHAAIVARELGIPAIVGCDNAFGLLNNGDMVTVECVGEIGNLYKGKLKFAEQKIDVTHINAKLKTIDCKIKLNLGYPNLAFTYANIPSAGVGLTRLEFLISTLGIHPKTLLEYDNLDVSIKSKLMSMNINSVEEGVEYYIEGISSGVSKIAASLYPREIIVRFSDFKSNEYRNLLGGDIYEPSEENPMIGFRGACRYYSDEFRECFKLECLALKRTIEEKGLNNISVMIPFCRTVDELLKVKTLIKEYGLRSKLYLMCEIPSNIILADEFSKHIDGFSIGSNDLTQLTLGLDRDSERINHVGDERNAAVVKSIKKVIKHAHKNGVTVGICGQAPSDFIDFAKYLIEIGIDSLSLTPDSFFETVNML